MPPTSALPSSCSSTSKSVFDNCLGVILGELKLSVGCCACWAYDFGALGFSNEKSLVYCAITWNCGCEGGCEGGGVTGGWPPLLWVDMDVSPAAKMNEVLDLTRLYRKSGLFQSGRRGRAERIAPEAVWLTQAPAGHKDGEGAAKRVDDRQSAAARPARFAVGERLPLGRLEVDDGHGTRGLRLSPDHPAHHPAEPVAERRQEQPGTQEIGNKPR